MTVAVTDHPRAAADDHEEPGPDLALVDDDVIGSELDLDRAIRDPRHARRVHIREEWRGSQEGGATVLGQRHGSSGRGGRHAAPPERRASISPRSRGRTPRRGTMPSTHGAPEDQEEGP